MPPPSSPALFPLTVLLVSVNVPELRMPPPPSPALFPLTVLLVSVNVPLLMPPPPRRCAAHRAVVSVNVPR